jgi:hypothetical protein
MEAKSKSLDQIGSNWNGSTSQIDMTNIDAVGVEGAAA